MIPKRADAVDVIRHARQQGQLQVLQRLYRDQPTMRAWVAVEAKALCAELKTRWDRTKTTELANQEKDLLLAVTALL